MQSEDIVTMHNSRKDFDRMVKEKLGDQVEYVEWYELLGFEAEPGLRDIQELKIVSEDGVHLNRKWNRRAAVNMVCRVIEEEVVVYSGKVESKKVKRD
jgi:hypothetical protein